MLGGLQKPRGVACARRRSNLGAAALDGSATIQPWIATLRAHMMPDGVEQALADADLALMSKPQIVTLGWLRSRRTISRTERSKRSAIFGESAIRNRRSIPRRPSARSRRTGRADPVRHPGDEAHGVESDALAR